MRARLFALLLAAPLPGWAQTPPPDPPVVAATFHNNVPLVVETGRRG